MKWVRVSSQFNSLFILHISTAKPCTLVRGYIEVHEDKGAVRNYQWVEGCKPGVANSEILLRLKNYDPPFTSDKKL